MLSPAQSFKAGVLAMLPIGLAAVPFSMVLGAEALRHGLTPTEIVFMSAMVFAGSAQFMAVGLWEHPAPWAGLAFAVLLINLRHVLMAASLSSKIKHFKPWQRFLLAFLMADETWALSERRAQAQPLTPPYYFGVGLCLYVLWFVGTALGTLAGGYIPKPELFGLDFIFPAIFIGLVMGFAKHWQAVPVILASAISALLAHHFIGGTSFVIVGGIAGMTMAALLPPPSGKRHDAA
jgi:4-azaleucine resistance transporter AzlC